MSALYPSLALINYRLEWLNTSFLEACQVPLGTLVNGAITMPTDCAYERARQAIY